MGDKKMKGKTIYLNIKVTNKNTRMSYEHRRVPLDHVEMIKMNSNLKVEILGPSYGANINEYKRDFKTS
jgi:hypothetical protein